MIPKFTLVKHECREGKPRMVASFIDGDEFRQQDEATTWLKAGWFGAGAFVEWAAPISFGPAIARAQFVQQHQALDAFAAKRQELRVAKQRAKKKELSL